MAGLGALGAGGMFAGQSLAVLGAGLLSGALAGGALLATGTVEFGGSPAAGGAGGAAAGLELVPCPDQGPVIGKIPQAQQVLVTARSADGGWLQLYWPAPGIERAWTKAGPLQLQGDLASLPVAACEAAPSATPRPTVEPTPTPEVTPTPTLPPTPTPAPTPSPTPKANAAPKVSGLAVSTKTVSFDQGSYCASDPKSVTFSVSASDADGLASVTLYYRPPGASKFVSKAMTPAGDRYTATLNTTTDNLRTAGELRYYVVAKDKDANAKSTRSPKSGSLAMTVKVCKNTGPKFTLLSASPSSIITDPLGAGCAGSTLSEFQARATDADGVKSIRLFFKKPGASSYTGRAFSKDGDTWYSFINTVSSVDNIVRSGTISWYAVATDDKGATTKTAVKSMKVTRCDSEASGGYIYDIQPSAAVTIGRTCGLPAIKVRFGVSDNDGVAASGLRLNWTLEFRAGGTLTGYTEEIKVLGYDGPNYANYEATLRPTTKWVPAAGSAGSLQFTRITTNDKYGGTTRLTPTGITSMVIYGCK